MIQSFYAAYDEQGHKIDSEESFTMKGHVTKEEIKEMIVSRSLTIIDVLDVVIDEGGLTTEKLIKLGYDLKEYVHSKINHI